MPVVRSYAHTLCEELTHTESITIPLVLPPPPGNGGAGAGVKMRKTLGCGRQSQRDRLLGGISLGASEKGFKPQNVSDMAQGIQRITATLYKI